MKRIAIGFMACCVLLQAGAEELKWLTDLPKAQAQAKKENKLVMLDFTGSDWCSWCIKLHKDVFSQKEFAEYAGKHLVLVEVDFPNKKENVAKQSDGLKKANAALQEKYKADGFPTLVVLDSDGKTLKQFVGYQSGGPKAFIEELDKLKKKS